METVKTLLRKNGINPSFHRIKILECLQTSLCHATADEIYMKLIPRIPTLSKTTVYNSLKTFTEKGLAKAIHIDNNELRYDANTEFHAHLKCDRCGRIFDLQFPPDHFPSANTEICGHLIANTQVLFTGICKKCRQMT